MAAAIAYQQTAVAETSAFFFAMLLAPKLLRRDAFIFLGTVVAITLAWLDAAIITAGVGKVAFALAGFYVDYTKKALPSSAAGGVAHFAPGARGSGLDRRRRDRQPRGRDRVDWVLHALGGGDPAGDGGCGAAVPALPGARRGAAHPAGRRTAGAVAGPASSAAGARSRGSRPAGGRRSSPRS